jgi:hypothetical protein
MSYRIVCVPLMFALSACGERLREVGMFEIELNGATGSTAAIHERSANRFAFAALPSNDQRGLRTVHSIETTAVRTSYDLVYPGMPEKVTCFVTITVFKVTPPLQEHLPFSVPIRFSPNQETGPYAHVPLSCPPVMNQLLEGADQASGIEEVQFAMPEGKLEVDSLDGEALVGRLAGKLMISSFFSF